MARGSQKRKTKTTLKKKVNAKGKEPDPYLQIK